VSAPIPIDRILADAEIAAAYFRALCDKGVSPGHAVSLTTSYISTVVIARISAERPREPWESEGKP
jgi:hypothetical protein